MNRLIIVGSPRTHGRSAALADLLFEACIEEFPEDEVALAPVATLDIEPCRGCDTCKTLFEQTQAAEAAGENIDGLRRCVIEDDMDQMYELIEAADEVVVVSPVYFAGVPAQMKALLDRLQPYFWNKVRKRLPKRPATLHVVGEGGDPHGFGPLVGEVRSALSCAGFALERVLDWVGKIDEDGEITAEATEYPLTPLPGAAAHATATRESKSTPESAPVTEVTRERPVLHVTAEKKPSSNSAKDGSKQNGSKQNSKQNRSKQNGKRRG